VTCNISRLSRAAKFACDKKRQARSLSLLMCKASASDWERFKQFEEKRPEGFREQDVFN